MRAAAAPSLAASPAWSRALAGLLCAFAFTLPLTEAPKNLAAALFMVLWAVRAVRTRDLGGRWDAFDAVFALMAGSAAVSAFVGGYAGDLSGALRVLAVAWLAKRSGLSGRQRRWVLAAACAGLAAALAVGGWRFALGRTTFLELPSVGHVNQSALYMAMLTGAALGWAVQAAARPRLRAWLIAALALALVLGLFVSASRAAILAFGAFVAAYLLVLALGRARGPGRRAFVFAAVSLSIAAAAVLAIGQLAPQLADRKMQMDHWVSAGSVEHRARHWNIAVQAWREQPWVGFGPESFRLFTLQRVCAWHEQRGEACDTARYSPAPHAHSLYFATLAERGLLGLAALAALLAVWGASLAHGARHAHRSAVWAASAAALAVTVVGGLFNTTLRVEHGSLALLLFALAFRPRVRRGPG